MAAGVQIVFLSGVRRNKLTVQTWLYLHFYKRWKQVTDESLALGVDLTKLTFGCKVEERGERFSVRQFAIRISQLVEERVSACLQWADPGVWRVV